MTSPLNPLASTPSPSAALLEAARALVPKLAEREAETTAARRVHVETIADFHRIGIPRVMQPRRFGGYQASFGLFSQIVETLAEGCASSAWVYAVLGEHQWIIACMPEQAQCDVWGDDPLAMASSSLAPRETARAAQGGWRLSGRFPFSSGCSHARWAIIGARCEEPAGRLATRYLLVPIGQADILDDWNVLGLRGTGSQTLRLDDVFVPVHRTVMLRDLLDGTTPGAMVHPDYRLLSAPRGLLVPFSLPTVAFTLGRRALALTAEILRTRVSRGTRLMSSSEVVQQQLGQAAAEIESACLVMRTRRDETMALMDSGLPIPMEAAPMEAAPMEAEMRNRRDIAFAVWQVRQGVERLVELVGARTVYDNDPLQNLWRDIVTISTHTVASRHLGSVPHGRWLMGLPPAPGEA